MLKADNHFVLKSDKNKRESKMKTNKIKGFTLAEVLITLAIIGVVAAISIPSVISNSQQQEFKTGLRKAVSVLNSAITINMALDGETPYDNSNTMGFFMKSMNVTRNVLNLSEIFATYNYIDGANCYNSAFYTTDGMRFEFVEGICGTAHYTHETHTWICNHALNKAIHKDGCSGCGSYGLNSNANNTTKPPCMIMVDVNGDRKPNPSNVNCKKENSDTCGKKNAYKYSDTMGTKLSDVFTIMITDKSAIPYGVAAQRAMYQAQK